MPKKKAHRRPKKNMFSLAAKDKSFKAAKKAKAKAEARAKKAWKKAISRAKKKIKRYK